MLFYKLLYYLGNASGYIACIIYTAHDTHNTANCKPQRTAHVYTRTYITGTTVDCWTRAQSTSIISVCIYIYVINYIFDTTIHDTIQ